VTEQEMDDQRDSLFSEVMEMNQHIVSGYRHQIKNLEIIRDAHLLQADRLSDIINLIAAGMLMTTETTGDLLLAEFGLTKVGEEDAESDSDAEDD